LVELILTLVAPIEMTIEFYASSIAISHPIFRKK